MGALTRFAAIPERAGSDERLRLRHLRVLIAVCRAVDGKSGLAAVSQKRVGERAGCSRQKANAAIAHLVRCGYLSKVDRRFSRSGGGGYLVYRVLYETGLETDDVTREGDRAHEPPARDIGDVTPSDHPALVPAGVTESNAEISSPENDTGQRRSGSKKDPKAAAPTDGTRAWREHRDEMQTRVEDLLRRSGSRRRS